MAGHVRDRWYKKAIRNGKPVRVKTADYGKGLRYKVEYPTPSGKSGYKSFPDGKKKEAQDFLLEKQDAVKSGKYIDPQGGKTLFGPFARTFVKTRLMDESTREVVERRLKNHILPTWETVPFEKIKPSGIRDWDAALKDGGLRASTREVVFAHMKAICNAAVDDGLITQNPCCAKSVVPPKAEDRAVVPWTRSQVMKVREGLLDHYRAIVDVGAGLGLRSGEIFGLSMMDVSSDERSVRVVRQVKLVRGVLCFGLPKNDRERTVPLPASTLAALKAHTEAYPAVSVTLPWEEPTGRPVTVSLVFTTGRGKAIKRTRFMSDRWKPARLRAGFTESDRTSGMHALRHYYASVLLDAGVSIKAVSAYLGHHDAGYTLQTYTHLMPGSADAAAAAVDALQES